MTTVWGIVIAAVGALAWLGQVLSALAPALAARLGLTEREADVDATFYADVRAECAWDSITLWTLPAGGALLLIDHPWWPVLALAGGGTYVYFAGRGIAQRLVMRARGMAVGSPKAVASACVGLAVMGIVGAGAAAHAAYVLLTEL